MNSEWMTLSTCAGFCIGSLVGKSTQALFRYWPCNGMLTEGGSRNGFKVSGKVDGPHLRRPLPSRRSRHGIPLRSSGTAVILLSVVIIRLIVDKTFELRPNL